MQASLGREREAIACLEESGSKELPAISRLFLLTQQTLLEGKKAESIEATGQLVSLLADPEGLFYMARQLAYLGETTLAWTILRRVVQEGFFCLPAFARDPWLDPLRTHPEFVNILRLAESRHKAAHAAFSMAGGESLLHGRIV